MKNEFGFILISGVRHAIPLIIPIALRRVILIVSFVISRVFVWQF